MLDLAFALLGFLLGLKGLPFLLRITVRVIIAKNYIKFFPLFTIVAITLLLYMISYLDRLTMHRRVPWESGSDCRPESQGNTTS